MPKQIPRQGYSYQPIYKTFPYAKIDIFYYIQFIYRIIISKFFTRPHSIAIFLPAVTT